MRLIDADNMKTLHEIQMANFNSIEDIQEWIDRQPTAYDVEKVVEQLDEYITKIVGRNSALYQTIIGIVRKGGVE